MSDATDRPNAFRDLAARTSAPAGAARFVGGDRLEPTRTAALPVSDTPTRAMPVESGLRLLSGRYLLQERIASGGMASVWRARDEVLARTVAVKLLHDHLAADPDFRERFRREAISAAKLSHPFIVGIYDSGVDGDQVFLVMEFVEGVTLRDVIIDTGALPPGQAAAIGEKVARALDYAHSRGLVHRDVKPANILMGNDGAVKVADFGIAKAEAGDDLTRTGMILGTAAYVAPEQITARPTDGKADQYALGCVLYETLTGRQPFKAETAVATAAQRLDTRIPNVRTLRKEVSPGLEQIVARAMALQPADRFPTSGHLADALAAHADHDTDRTAALVSGSLDLVPAAPESSALVPLPADLPRRSDRREAQSSGGGIGRFVLPVLGLLVFAVGLLAALWTGAIGTGGTGADTEAGAAEPTSISLTRDNLSAFDPDGDGSERDNQLASLVDGDPNTVWSTESYETADFGGLKDGVGVLVDLGVPTRVDAVELTVPADGLNVELRAADAPPSNVAGTTQVADTREGGSPTIELRPGDPVETRYLLLWITAPLPDMSGTVRPYRAQIADIVVQGAPADAGT
jgi:serine/threonine-protein kinase